MRLTQEALDRILLLVRFALLAAALIALFVFEMPALAVLIATGALLIRMALFVPSIREWLTARFVGNADKQNGDHKN